MVSSIVNVYNSYYFIYVLIYVISLVLIFSFCLGVFTVSLKTASDVSGRNVRQSVIIDDEI